MSPNGQPQLLVVEDDQEISTLLQRYMSARQWQCTMATDGDVAWQHFLERPFDAVLTDLMMPRRSGYDLILQMRSHITRARTPILVMTASVQTPREEEALRQQLKVDAVFRKPLPLRDLMVHLDGLLRPKMTPAPPPAQARTRSQPDLAPVPAAATPFGRPVSRSGSPQDLPSPAHTPAPFGRPVSRTGPVEELPPPPHTPAPFGRPSSRAGGVPGHTPLPPSRTPSEPPPALMQAQACSLPALARFFLQAFETRMGGALELRCAGGSRVVLLHDGMVVDALSSVRQESLEQLLSSMGLPSPVGVNAARVLLPVLDAAGMPAWRMVVALEHRARLILQHALLEQAGTFVVSPFPGNPWLAARMRLDPVEVIQRAALAAPADLVTGWLKTLEGHTAAPADTFNERVLLFARLRPNSGVPMGLTQPAPLQQVVRQAQATGPDGVAELAALVLSGAVELAGAAGPPGAGGRRTSTLGSAMAPTWTIQDPVAMQVRDAVAREWLRTLGQNAYAVLQVEPHAPWDAVERALEALDAQLGPALDRADLGPAKAYVTLMRTRRDEVRRVLANPESRAAYDCALLVHAAGGC